MRWNVVLLVAAAAVACKKEGNPASAAKDEPKVSEKQSAATKKKVVSAMSVCEQLGSDVAKDCQDVPPKGTASEFDPGGAAKELAEFKLASIPSQKGKVMLFESADDFDAAMKGYEDLKGLAVHTYGSRSAKVIVWLNSDATKTEGKKVEGIVETL